MDAPTCRICGHKHWSRVCDVGPADPRNDAVTKRVTVTPPVTASVTPRDVPRTVAPSKLAAAQKEIEALTAELAQCRETGAAILAEGHGRIAMLEAEVAHLKRQLAERAPLKVPLTSKERVAKHRAKAKQVV